jgi:predicted nucleic acid-binding protein
VTAKLVLNACVALKWTFRDETEINEADVLLQDMLAGKVILLTPTLFDYEITNTLKIGVMRARISEADAIRALQQYRRFNIQRYDFFPLQALAFQLANQHQRSVYDATYLALAQSQGIDLITGDKRLFNAVNSTLSWVKWIGDYQPV